MQKSAAKTASLPIKKSAAKTASLPIQKSAAKTASLPMQKLAAKISSMPIQKSAAKTASLPMQKSAAKTASLPIKKSAAKTESSILSIYIFFFSFGCLQVSRGFDSATHPLLPHKSSTKLLPRLTPGFDIANSPFRLINN